MAITTDSWVGTASADWGASATNWSTGFPNSNNNVVIDTAAIQTITYSGGDTYIINKLTVGQDFFDMIGGSLTVLTTASFADNFTQTGGTLTVGGTASITGTGTLTGGGSEGKTNFSISGTIALANYTLGGASVLTNAATTNQTGTITVGDNTDINAGIVNQSGATYTIAGDWSINRGAASASFANAGTVQKTAGNSTSTIDLNYSGAGSINVNTGTIEFRGPNDTFSGAISGAGTFALGGGGTSTISGAATIGTAGFSIVDNGTSVTLGKALSYSGAFALTQNSTLNIGAHTLTLHGTNTFDNLSQSAPVVTGSLTLATAAGSLTHLNDLVLGGTVNWQNAGTVSETGTWSIGDSTSNSATFTNLSGGVFNLTQDVGIVRGASAGSQFVNNSGATLAKTGGSGTSTIGLDFSGAGAITVNTGTIEFFGPNNTFSGAISGAGTFELGGGASTIASGAAITTTGFAIVGNGTSVALGEALTYKGTFALTQNSTLNIGAHKLTLQGTNTFDNLSQSPPVITGSAILATTASSLTHLNDLVLGGTVNWENDGKVNETGNWSIGDGTSNSATFTNLKGGVFSLTQDVGIFRGASAGSQFINNGGATLAKTGGTGTSTIALDVTDNGTITIASGTLNFDGPNASFNGAISGNGTLSLSGGLNDIQSSAAITTGTWTINSNGTAVLLDEDATYANAFFLRDSSSLTLDNHTFTLTGTNQFLNDSQSFPVINGSGVLATSGTTSVSGFDLGGTVNWQNSGTVNELGTFQIGDGTSNFATFTNQSGGVFNLTNGAGITTGASAQSSFVNAAGATLNKTAGGTSTISATMTDSGAISIAAGALDFVGPNNTFAGAISGAGELDFTAGTSTIKTGTTITTPTLVIEDNGTSVSLTESLTYAGSFSFLDNATVNIGPHTLTLSGNDTFDNQGQALPIITGSGFLVTTSASVINLKALELGGTVSWHSSGTVNETGPLQIGDSSNVATFINESHASYIFTNNAGIEQGAASTSSFTNNAGAALTKSGGTGTSEIDALFINNGTVNANSGTIEFTNAVSGSGTFNIGLNDALDFTNAVAAGPTVHFQSTSGGGLLLDDSPQFLASISGFGGNATDFIDVQDINFDSVNFGFSYSGNSTAGTLMVTDGNRTAELAMIGNYSTGSFHASTDGGNGVKFTDPTLLGHGHIAFAT